MRTKVVAILLLLQAGLCLASWGAPAARKHPAKTAAAPVVASLTPSSVSLSQAPGRDPLPSTTDLLVHGSGFRPGARVLWGGDPQETRFISSSELAVTLDWRLLAPVPRQAGSGASPASHVPVTVRNRTGKPSRPVTFDIVLGMIGG